MGNINSPYVPKLDPDAAKICFVTNIIWPGSGTIMATFMERRIRWWSVWTGFWQMLLSPFLLGWFWSILTGYLIWKKSKPLTEEEEAIRKEELLEESRRLVFEANHLKHSHA